MSVISNYNGVEFIKLVLSKDFANVHNYDIKFYTTENTENTYRSEVHFNDVTFLTESKISIKGREYFAKEGMKFSTSTGESDYQIYCCLVESFPPKSLSYDSLVRLGETPAETEARLKIRSIGDIRDPVSPLKDESKPKFDKDALHNKDKLRPSLLNNDFIEDMCKTITLGANKYGADNYHNCEDPDKILDAMLRHIIEYRKGKKADAEGNNHLSAVAVNAMMLHYLQGQIDWSKELGL